MWLRPVVLVLMHLEQWYVHVRSLWHSVVFQFNVGTTVAEQTGVNQTEAIENIVQSLTCI